MTVDISNLSQEKQVFLKANRALLESLDNTIPKEVRNTEKTIEKRRRTLSKWQQKTEDYEEAMRLAEVERVLNLPASLSGFATDAIITDNTLVCPNCGKGETARMHGNKGPKGQPWCARCNSPLVPRKKLNQWKNALKIKAVTDKLKRDLHKLNPGLNPKNEEVP